MDIYPNIIPRTKYVMSLDSLDLSLLPIEYPTRLNNTQSLWTFNNLNRHKNDYFQFEVTVKAEKSAEPSVTDEESNNDVVSLLDKTMCYICNITVPLPYLSDHENNLKHKTLVKITDVALTRARQHIMKKNDSRNAQKLDSTYYCGPCEDIVRNIDRNVHEKSKSHKHHVSIGRLLSELVTLYADDDHYENVNTTGDNLNDVKTQISSDSTNETVVISDLSTRMHDHDKRTSDHEKSYNIREYIKLLDQYNAEKLYTLTVDGGNIKIQTQDGAEVVVSEDNFHGFLRIGGNIVQCILCEVTVDNESDHKSSATHIRSIVKPFLDKHCVRNLDNSWSHCVLCNLIIDNSDMHALCNESHAKLLEKALVVNEIENDEMSRPVACHYCSACNVSMHVNNVVSHEKGHRHIRNMKATTYDYNGRDANDYEETISPTSDDGILVVPKSSKSTKVNNDGDRHKNNISSEPNAAVPKNDDKNVNVDEYSYLCDVCSVIVPNNPQGIKIHNDGVRHKKNVAKLVAAAETARGSANAQTKPVISYLMSATPNEKELVCNVCNSIIPNVDDDIVKHVIGNKHNNNENQLMSANSIVVKNDKYYCDACNSFIKNEKELVHIAEPKHKNNLKKSNKPKVDAPNNTQKSVEATEVVNKNKDKDTGAKKTNVESVDILYSIYKHHFHQNDENLSTLTCRVCDVSVPNTPGDALNHAAEIKHRDGYKNLMSQNLMFVSECCAFFCGICKCAVPARGEFHHVFGERHAKNLVAVRDENICSNKADHSTRSLHIDKLKTNQDFFYYCHTCGGLVTKNNDKIEQHIKYCSLMTKHKLVLKDKVCYCSICDQYFTRELIKEHIESNHHLLLFSEFKQ